MIRSAEQCVDGSPPFTCDGGSPVPYVYLCDGVVDCADMADESDELCGF